jgi:hypothetical protein
MKGGASYLETQTWRSTVHTTLRKQEPFPQFETLSSYRQGGASYLEMQTWHSTVHTTLRKQEPFPQTLSSLPSGGAVSSSTIESSGHWLAQAMEELSSSQRAQNSIASVHSS